MIVLMKADSAFTGLSYVKWYYPFVGTLQAKKLCMLSILGEDAPPTQESSMLATAYYGEAMFRHIGQNTLAFTNNVAVSEAGKVVAQYTTDFLNLFRKTANINLANFTLSGSDGFVIDFAINNQTRYMASEGEGTAWEMTATIPFTCIVSKVRS
jgi:hypothetical protein